MLPAPPKTLDNPEDLFCRAITIIKINIIAILKNLKIGLENIGFCRLPLKLICPLIILGKGGECQQAVDFQ